VRFESAGFFFKFSCPFFLSACLARLFIGGGVGEDLKEKVSHIIAGAIPATTRRGGLFFFSSFFFLYIRL